MIFFQKYKIKGNVKNFDFTPNFSFRIKFNFVMHFKIDNFIFNKVHFLIFLN